MKVFLPIQTQQTLRVRARNVLPLYSIKIRQELTDETITLSDIPALSVNGYIELPLSANFQEGEHYEIEVLSTEGVEWRGKAFITAKTPSTYKLNENV